MSSVFLFGANRPGHATFFAHLPPSLSSPPMTFLVLLLDLFPLSTWFGFLLTCHHLSEDLSVRAPYEKW